jgi:hypothetical protein
MISIELNGRLGNQMFQYSVCRIAAEKNGYNFYISREPNAHGQNISDYFNLDMGINDGSHLVFRYSENTHTQTYNPDVFNIADNTIIHGFYQTDKYFSGYEDKIKKWFSIETDHKTDVILSEFPIEDYCYLHFRGTDYKNWDDGKKFLPKKYFDDAIKKIREHKDDIKVLIITDDPVLANEIFPGERIISNDLMTDFKLLYYSKYCIIPNSSFSWWASWLSDKYLTIAPYCWLNYNYQDLGFYPADIESDKFIYIK